jgi:DNA polymerase-3 subunit epsilon
MPVTSTRTSSTSEIAITSAEKAVLFEYFPKGITAFDLEMTGLSPLLDKIIEIAAVKLLPDGEVKTFHQLINPLITIPEHTIQFHGLRNEDLKDEPALKIPLKSFLQFIDNSPLLAHNGMFDASFMIVGMHENGLIAGLSDVFDSCKLSRLIFKSKRSKQLTAPDNNKLSGLASFYEIKFTHHQAMDDAIVCLKVFAQLLLEHKENHSSTPIKDLAFLFKLNSFKQPGEYILPNKIAAIKPWVQSQSVFEMKYKGGSMKGEFRKIKPLSLLALPQGLVLYAECLVTSINKYFQVKKIQSVRALVPDAANSKEN